MKLPARTVAAAIAGVVLTATGGYLTSQALSAGSQAVPTRTVTLTLTGGPTGPAGPQGPPGARGPAGPTGPSGANECPAGSTFGKLTINHPGGHVSIFTCIED